MKILLAIIGYIVGLFLGIMILAMISSATDSDSMGSSFIFGNISGIVCAIIGYNMGSKKNVEK